MGRFSKSIAFGTRMGILAVKAASQQAQPLGFAMNKRAGIGSTIGATLGTVGSKLLPLIQPDLNNPVHQGVLGAAVGGGGTALYDLVAGTEDNKLQRALLGAGIGGAGGVGLGAIKRMADDHASALIKEEQNKVREAAKGHKSKRQLANEQDVKDHGIYQTFRIPAGQRETAAISNIAGMGVNSVRNAIDDVKGVIHNGAVVPLKDLFIRKLQEAEANRVAANRDALMANSTGNAMGTLLNIPAINASKPAVPARSIPAVGSTTSQDDIAKMREAIRNGRP